jgi:hypothetical protein
LGLYGFLTGFSVSFLRADADMGTRLFLGTIIAFVSMAASAKNYRAGEFSSKQEVQSTRNALDNLQRRAQEKHEEKHK